MGMLVRFTGQHHVRASATDPILAKASKVISASPRSEAKRDKASQCVGGMPRTRQTLTVEGASDSAEDTALVPPSASMTESVVIMDQTVVCETQTSQEFAFRKTTFVTGCDAIRPMPDSREVIFGRLEALRLELHAIDPKAGFDAEGRFASAAGIDKTTYSLMKKYDRDLPFNAACRIKEIWGISLDWLYYGDQPAGAQIMARIGRGPVAEIRLKSVAKRKAG
jgi:hypothetical protein